MKVRSLILLLAFLIVVKYDLVGNNTAFEPAEKVFINTNQPYYLSGDKIEFSAIVVSYLTFKPSKNSEVLHLSLYNSDQDLILKSKVILEDGFGAGVLEIPKELSSGNYILVANTTWMLNFKENQYSKKVIKIIGADEELSEEDDEPFTINFFPEGGEIISGHLNQVAFQTNKPGDQVSGVILSDHTDTVGVFSSYKYGYGKFNFFANDSSSYEAIVEMNGKNYKYPLGKAFNNSVSLKIIDNAIDTLVVFANIGSQYEGEKLELLIQNKGEIILGSQQKIVSNRLKFLIPKNLLREGLSQLAVLNDIGDVLSERLYFIEKSNKLEFTSDWGKTSFKPNENIKLPLLITDHSSQSKNLNLSISITNTKYFGQSDLNPMDYSINLLSEVAFTPSEPNFIQLLEDSQFLDIFLITQKMETFSLEKDQENSTIDASQYIIEKASKVQIAGRVKDKNTDTYIKDSVILCSVIGESPQLIATKTNEEGYFLFELRPFTSEAEVILKLSDVDESQENIVYELEQNLPKLQETDFSDLKLKNIDPQLFNNYVNYKQEDLIIQRIYNPNPTKTLDDPMVSINNGFFLSYNYERDFTEYIALNNFREMVRELIPGVVIKEESSSAKIYLKEFDEKNNYLIDPFPNQPLRLIDGMPVFDSNEILDINPEKVKMLRLINSRFSLNGVIFDGIFEMTTVDGDFHQNLQSNHLKYGLEGFSEQSENLNDETAIENNNYGRTPNFKSVLYWNPSLKMKTNQTKQVEFRASDDIGEFLVQIKGMDEEGNIINYQTTFRVEE